MPSGLTHSELTARARSLVVQPWSRQLPWFYAATDVGLAAYGALLWASGYPRWRSGVALCVALAWGVSHAFELRARSRTSERAVAGRAASTLWVMVASGFAVVAVTGGIGSPLVPGAVAALPLYLFQFGWTPRAKLHWAATALGLGLVAALPRAWAGPGIRDPLYWTVAAANVSVMVAAAVVYVALLTRVGHASLREANRAREELTLQAMARARELEQLGAQLSHELKNPLSAIKTLVQLSAREVQSEESRERLEVIEGEIRRMQQVLQDYLSFSRPLERIRPEDVELGDLAEDVVALLDGRARDARVALLVRGDARVVADPARVKEALLNVVANALEASPAGSRVEVTVGQEGGTARVVVVDRGRGMPPDVLAKVGIPFFTTREEGTGLGVALARATFVRHGGGLSYASEPGEGTTATATLPAVAARRSDGARARGG